MVHSAPSDTREAEIIAAMIADKLHEGDVLVLLPKDGYAEPLKAVLSKRRISFESSKPRATEAKLIFSALRNWIADPTDNLAFRELLQAVANSGIAGIPGPLVKKAEKIAERESALAKISSLWLSVFDSGCLRDALRIAASTDEQHTILDSVANDLTQATSSTPTDLAYRTFEALKPWLSSTRMLDELADLPADFSGSQGGDASLVRIMTMRNSKGLQARTVFVIGLEEGAFPSGKGDSPEFQEEARLFYVSMTRAEEELHLFHVTKRSGGMTYKAKSFGMKASPFLAGLPSEHCESQYHPSASQRLKRK